MSDLKYVSLQGAAIASVLEPLAALRIAVFRDFPYLYEGTLEYERDYLRTYVRAERALLFAVYDGADMIGATTCIPLTDETPEVQQPFIDARLDLTRIFYFGESILLPQYRGLGIGHRFFDAREAHVRQFGAQYTTTCFCAVVRPDDHPLRPARYRPLDAFWQSRGYQKAPHLVSQFSWRDIGQSGETPKPMIYWVNDLMS